MAGTMKKKTAIYCRVANYSPDCMEAQKEAVLRHALERGYAETKESICVYADNGVCGIGFDRPGFSEMAAGIAKGEIGTVIVKSIDRISRDFIGTDKWLNEMRGLGIAVKTMDGSFGETCSQELETMRRLIIKEYNKQPRNQSEPCNKGGA